jgi:hypothetical protein
MAFSLIPDEGPPRLIRFTKLGGELLCVLNVESNLLMIDKAKYDRLTPDDQHLVLRTQAPSISLPPKAWN